MRDKENHDALRRARKWLGRAGSATVAAGIILAQHPASANPVIQRLLEQATTRSVAVSSRREDVQLPDALVIEPAATGGVILAGHRSHSSHSSHSSHRSSSSYDSHASHTSHRSAASSSSYSPSVPYSPPARTIPATSTPDTSRSRTSRSTYTPPQVKPEKWGVSLKDGSWLIGDMKKGVEHTNIECSFGIVQVPTSAVKGTKAKSIGTGDAAAASGRYVIVIDGDQEYRADAEETGGHYEFRVNGIKRTVPKLEVDRAIRLSDPKPKPEPSPSLWYIITLKDGSEIRGQVSREENGYLLKFRYGEIRVKSDDVRSFEVATIVYRKADAATPDGSTSAANVEPSHSSQGNSDGQ